ncbi:MAG: hypothetical protein ABFD16_04115 [Thermoguttaceae bacterium]|jgi:hypothetical protein
MSDDRFDANPYQSPALADGERGSDTLTEAIHIKGALSLDDVQRAYPLCTVGVQDLIVRFLIVLFLTKGLGPLWQAAPRIAMASCLIVVLPLLGQFFRKLLASRFVRRLCKQQQGIFAQREATITNEAIEMNWGGVAIHTPWAEYSEYESDENTIWLYLSRPGWKRRREQGGPGERPSRFGVNLQKIDIFPRRQFENDAEWERFQRVVKQKPWRWWAWIG